ncbi:MAG: GAF domain-containing sensor histidine kinase [Kiritimatiellae bacterium]|nr:GAF domain-containing sensor histidine kinase [Kiritimatiellia bacterium]
MCETGNLQYPERGAEGAPRAFSPKERRVLQQINRKVAAAESLASLLTFVFESTRDVQPCDRLCIAFLEEDGHRIRSQWVKTVYQPVRLPAGYAEDLQAGSLARVVREGRPRLINDLEAYLTAHPDSRSSRLLVAEGVRSSMTCPLRVGARTVGVLFRSSRRPSAYTPRHVAMHLAIAERLSQAVDKARRIEQLAAANKAYGEMLGFVTHELKSPIAGAITDLDVLLGGYLGGLEPRQREKALQMRTRLAALLGLVGDYLDLARVETGGLRLRVSEAVDLARAVLEPALESVAPLFEARNMRLVRRFEPNQTRAVACDADLLRIVVLNLLSNAAKYGRMEGEVRLGADALPDAFRVSVWNEGRGFTGEQQGRLFRRFSRLAIPEFKMIQGSGVGLYTAWRIVRLHGGTIRARSEPDQWAEFLVTIPQPLVTHPAEAAAGS